MSGSGIRTAKMQKQTNMKTKGNSTAVQRRNARERHRILQVNRAFDGLRQKVPSANSPGKISKVETLRSAIEYIKALESIIKMQDKEKAIQLDIDSYSVSFDPNNWIPSLESQSNDFDLLNYPVASLPDSESKYFIAASLPENIP